MIVLILSGKSCFSLNAGIKSSSFLCGMQCILGQKVSTKSWMAALSLSPLREYCYHFVLSSNIRLKGDKMKGENNPIRLPLETWCSLSVPQCTASNKANWNSCINSHYNLQDSKSHGLQWLNWWTTNNNNKQQQ